MDLNQGSMLQVTAKVTLTPSELREYRRLESLGDEVRGEVRSLIATPPRTPSGSSGTR